MSGAGKLILIIDDDENFLKGMTAIIKLAGYAVIAANNGPTGVMLAKENKPDLIICDVMMPTLNGFEVFKLLRQRTETANIPFIFLTARVANADKMAALSRGVLDYITKPFDKADLITRIESTLQNARARSATTSKASAQAKLKIEDLYRAVAKTIPPSHLRYKEQILNTLEYTIKNRFNDLVELEWYIRRVMEDNNALYGLLNDLLVLINLDNGRVGSTRPEINVINDFRDPLFKHFQLYSNKSLNMSVLIEPGLKCHLPKFEFTRSAVHLLDNACKFSAEKAEIVVYLARAGKDGCILTVINEGENIPLEQRNLVFERNSFVASNVKSTVTLGVGLYIARAVAQQLGGHAVILECTDCCGIQVYIPPTAH